jgi:hypothetical protein
MNYHPFQKKQELSLELKQITESGLRGMKKIDENLKAVPVFDKGCISLMYYIVSQDEYKAGEGAIFLRHLKCGRQFTEAARNRAEISLSSLLCAACSNRTIIYFAAARSTLAPRH